jgi:hypothetical protein
MLVAILCLASISHPLAAAPAGQSVSDPLVLAFYYTWFDQSTWTYDKLSDLPAQPYTSSDRGVMGRHIDQAKAAGIDAFLVAWYGPGGGNQTEPNLTALLEEAAVRGFRIGVLFETNSPFLGGVGDVSAALQHLHNVHAAHPAYLRVDGRPVVFFWRPSLYGVDSWRSLRNQSDPGHGAIWISEGVDTSYLAVFDGHHLYTNTWNPPADLNATNQKFASRVASARQSSGVFKFWVATVMPGYNDVRIRGGFARDRQGGAYYAQSWQAAIASNPNWIVINSFNEWPEGSYIEPSAAFGDQYLAATASYSQQFKSGGATVQAAALPPIAPQAAPTPFPEPDSPTAFVTAVLLNVRGGPGTSFPVVAQLPAGEALPITGSDPQWPGWWQVSHNGETAWVFGELVHAAGPLDQTPVVKFTAVETAAVDGADGAPSSLQTTPLATTGEVPLLPGDPPPLLFIPGRASLTPYLSR